MGFKFYSKRLLCCSMFTGFLCVGPIWAEEPGLSQNAAQGNVFNLGEVVVQGKAETITEVATVETVSKERIELTNAVNVA